MFEFIQHVSADSFAIFIVNQTYSSAQQNINTGSEKNFWNLV